MRKSVLPVLFGLIWLFANSVKVRGQTSTIKNNPFVWGTNGEEISSASIFLTYSVGEPFVDSIGFCNNPWLQAGYLQPYPDSDTIFCTVGIVDQISNPGIWESFDVFPNPTSGFLNLQGGFWETRKVSYQLFSILGSPLKTGNFQGKTFLHSIDLAGLSAGHYILRVTLDQGEHTRHFKIIKF